MCGCRFTAYCEYCEYRMPFGNIGSRGVATLYGCALAEPRGYY